MQGREVGTPHSLDHVNNLQYGYVGLCQAYIHVHAHVHLQHVHDCMKGCLQEERQDRMHDSYESCSKLTSHVHVQHDYITRTCTTSS